jgi:galactose mutarotase-like enzyme
VFPFAHELLYEARLAHGRLELALTIHAGDRDGVPLAFGFHPYLCLPGTSRERWQVELPAMRRLALDVDQISIGADRTMPVQRFLLGEQVFDDAFDRLAEPSRFAVAAAGRRVEVEFLAGYPCAQVFAPLDTQCVCFEPMAAPPNALRSGMGLRILRRGDCARARFSVRVEDIRDGTPRPEDRLDRVMPSPPGGRIVI